MSDLVIEQKVEGNTVKVSLKGKMADTAEYSTIKVAGSAAAEFDFEGVTMINSKGVQIWKEFMQALPPGLKVSYQRCPLKVVNQLNLFPSFKGGKVVEVSSFYAPYFCATCDEPRSVLLETVKYFTQGKVAVVPPMSCDKCKKPMELDANPQKYFLFMQRAG